MNNLVLTPRRPHLFRAFYDWLVENDLTPYVVVDATLPNVDVPMQYVKDGQIVLNIAMRAVEHLDLGNEFLSFSARFSGNVVHIKVPMYAVTAIYAKENGAGTMFDAEPAYDKQLEALASRQNVEVVAEDSKEGFDVEETVQALKPKGKPTLTVVK